MRRRLADYGCSKNLHKFTTKTRSQTFASCKIDDKVCYLDRLGFCGFDGWMELHIKHYPQNVQKQINDQVVGSNI